MSRTFNRITATAAAIAASSALLVACGDSSDSASGGAVSYTHLTLPTTPYV